VKSLDAKIWFGASLFLGSPPSFSTIMVLTPHVSSCGPVPHGGFEAQASLFLFYSSFCSPFIGGEFLSPGHLTTSPFSFLVV